MMKIVKWLAWLAVGLLLIASFLGLVGCEKKYSFNSIDVTGVNWGKNIELPGLNGNVFQAKDFDKKVTAIFFGFLSCPDACPNTLVQMVRLKKALGKRAKDLQVIFVSVDPNRDTSKRVKEFLHSFDKDFKGSIIPEEKLDEIKKEFKLVVQRVSQEKTGNDMNEFYLIDHTTHTYIYDKEGTLRLISPESVSFSELLNDITYLIEN